MAKVNKSSVSLVNGQGSASNSATLTTGLGSEDFHLPFQHTMYIPKNTTQAGYLSYTLVLPIGRINRIWVEFPKGCSGLAGFQLWRGVTQLFPLPAGEWLAIETPPIYFEFTHYIDTEPYNVEMRGYNLDDTYQHKIWVSLEMSGLPGELSQQMQSFLQAVKAG